MKAANESSENVANIDGFGMVATDQIYMNEELQVKWTQGMLFYCSVRKRFFFLFAI